MTLHVNIGEAKARLSELVSAAVRGEDVVLDKAGVPQARLVPIQEASDAARKRIGERRRAAFGMWKDNLGDWDGIVPPSMTDDEIDARERRICGPAD
jgi:prevent-host-death family protein